MIVLEDLVELDVFAGTPRGLIAHVAARAADMRLNSGEYVIHEGEVPSFFIVLDGKLELTKRYGPSERVIAQRQPGDFFGEVPLLLGSTTFAGLRAIEHARVARFDAIDFHTIVHESAAFEAIVRRALEERVDGIREIAREVPVSEITLVGRRVDSACHTIRDFLSRNHVAYDFLEVEESCTLERFPQIDGKLDRCPIVILSDGKLLIEPTLREVAYHLDLQIEPKEREYDVAIIGGGPAGLAAAVYGASEGLRTLMIEREAPGGQAGTSSRIENYLGFPSGISGDELGSRALEQAKRLGAEIVVTRQVTAIYPSQGNHDILLDGGDLVRTRAIVVATGVRWRMLPIEGIERYLGAGVYFGAARTEAMNAQGKDVYLVGAGNSAGQAAMFFANYARTVTLVVRGRTLEASMSDYLVKQLHGKENIAVELSSEVTAVFGGVHLEAIEITERRGGTSRRCETDAVFVFIGAEAVTGWLPETIARDARGYLLTGPAVPSDGGTTAWTLGRDPLLLETSVPGIFAAGDVRANSVKRVAAGVGEGIMAIAFIHQYLDETRAAAESKLAGSL